MLLPVALRVLLHLLGCCQSTALLQNAFATQRALVYKVKKILKCGETGKENACMLVFHREKMFLSNEPRSVSCTNSSFYCCAMTIAWLADELERIGSSWPMRSARGRLLLSCVPLSSLGPGTFLPNVLINK